MKTTLVESPLVLDLDKLRMKEIYVLSEEEVLQLFVGLGLLRNRMSCAICGTAMRINKREKLADGIWVGLVIYSSN